MLKMLANSRFCLTKKELFAKVQKYFNNANGNAKNVRKICENVRNLTESAIKELIWNPIQVQGRKKEKKMKERERSE